MADKISVEEMLSQIQEWHSEVTNFRNDGWTQKGYRDKIKSLHSRLTTMVESVQLTTDEPVKDADGSATAGSNRSLSNRYSGDPRDKDS
jgi:hypothetical protein